MAVAVLAKARRQTASSRQPEARRAEAEAEFQKFSEDPTEETWPETETWPLSLLNEVNYRASIMHNAQCSRSSVNAHFLKPAAQLSKKRENKRRLCKPRLV